MPEKIERGPKIEKEEKPSFKDLIERETISQMKELIKTPEGLVSFEGWWKLDEQGKEARQIRKIAELLTAGKSILEKNPERKEEISQNLLEFLNLKKDIASRSRIDQFQAFLITEILGLEKPRIRKEVEKMVGGLKKLKSTEGELNALELLSSSKIDFGVKKNGLKRIFCQE